MSISRVRSDRACFLDIGQSTIKVLFEDRGLELRVDRSADGRLTPASRDKVREELRAFLGGRVRTALCALPARGVSLRHFTLPRASSDETRKLLTLQLEKDFPLSLDDLAWGYRDSSPETPSKSREITVAAVRREVLEDYDELLAGLGLRTVYCLAGLARSSLCQSTRGTYGVLEVRADHSELILLDGGKPLCLRSLPWGNGTGGGGETGAGDDPSVTDPTLQRLVDVLAEALGVHGNGDSSVPVTLYVTPEAAATGGFAQALSRSFPGRIACENLELPEAPGVSAATHGLRRLAARQENGHLLTLTLPDRKRQVATGGSGTGQTFWLAAAVLLGVVALSIPYLRPLVGYSSLEERLHEERGRLESMPNVDGELGFLRHVDSARSRVAHLDLLAAISRAAPDGTWLSNVSITREGEIAIQGSMPTREHVNQFRLHLLKCGLFTSVVPHETTPVDGDQVRFSLDAVARIGATLDQFAEPPPAPIQDATEPDVSTPPDVAPADEKELGPEEEKKTKESRTTSPAEAAQKLSDGKKPETRRS